MCSGVVSGVGDCLPRNCCCLKFWQSWNRTKQALPCACGKGKSDVTRGKINFYVFGGLSKEITEAGSVVEEVDWGKEFLPGQL